jgi:hypothetical protein
VLVAEPGDELLAEDAAEVPDVVGVLGGGEGADLDGGGGGVGDDETPGAAVPLGAVLEDVVEMLAHEVDRGGVVEVEEDGAGHAGVVA